MTRSKRRKLSHTNCSSVDFTLRCETHGVQVSNAWSYMTGEYICPECYRIKNTISRDQVVHLSTNDTVVTTPNIEQKAPKKSKVTSPWQCDIKFDPNDYNSFAYELYFAELDYLYIGIKMFSREWQTYHSSSTYVKEIIASGHIPTYTITHLFTDWNDAKIFEHQRLVELNVPANPRVLNLINDWSSPSHKNICETHYKKLRTFRL